MITGNIGARTDFAPKVDSPSPATLQIEVSEDPAHAGPAKMLHQLLAPRLLNVPVNICVPFSIPPTCRSMTPDPSSDNDYSTPPHLHLVAPPHFSSPDCQMAGLSRLAASVGETAEHVPFVGASVAATA